MPSSSSRSNVKDRSLFNIELNEGQPFSASQCDRENVYRIMCSCPVRFYFLHLFIYGLIYVLFNIQFGSGHFKALTQRRPYWTIYTFINNRPRISYSLFVIGTVSGKRTRRKSVSGWQLTVVTKMLWVLFYKMCSFLTGETNLF